MKIFLALVLLVASAFAQAQAAPWHLTAAVYPSTGFLPTSTAYTINGGSQIACATTAVTGGVKPDCSLAAITAFGTYTLVMIVTFPAGCLNTPNQGTCTNGGPVSSDPFQFVYSSGLASKPPLSVGP